MSAILQGWTKRPRGGRIFLTSQGPPALGGLRVVESGTWSSPRTFVVPRGFLRIKNLDILDLAGDTVPRASVVFTPEARKQFFELPRSIRPRILQLTERLRAWPQTSGVKALSGNLAGYFRVRTGDYRLLFRVQGETIFVEKIGHRDKFY